MDTLQYIKIILKKRYDKEQLTNFEHVIGELYGKCMYEAFIYNKMHNTDKLISDVDILLQEMNIITLVFSNGAIRYIEKKILCTNSYFNNLFEDGIVDNSFLLNGIIDNEVYMDILIYYLKFGKIKCDETMLTNLDIYCDILMFFDYTCNDLHCILKCFSYSEQKNINLEKFNYIAAFMAPYKNDFSYDLYQLFAKIEEQLFLFYSVDEVFSSTLFKLGAMKHDGHYYILKYKYYPLYYKIADKWCDITLLADLLDDKPDDWWRIMNSIYDKVERRQEHMDVFLFRNKDKLDITFFDINTDKYDQDLVTYLKTKFYGDVSI